MQTRSVQQRVQTRSIQRNDHSRPEIRYKIKALIYFRDLEWSEICNAFRKQPRHTINEYQQYNEEPDYICGIGWINMQELLEYSKLPNKKLKSGPYYQGQDCNVQQCQENGDVYCKFITLNDYFGWLPDEYHLSNVESEPQLCGQVEVPIGKASHYLFCSIYADETTSARRTIMEYCYSEIPEDAKILLICEAVYVQHNTHFHTPHCNIISGSYETRLDDFMESVPNIKSTLQREIAEETGINLTGKCFLGEYTQDNMKKFNEISATSIFEVMKKHEPIRSHYYLSLINLDRCFSMLDDSIDRIPISMFRELYTIDNDDIEDDNESDNESNEVKL